MTVLEKILQKLDEANVSYEEYTHQPVHTSEDASRVRGTDMGMGAKALIFWADKKLRLFVLPADKKANTKKIKTNLGIKDLYMASPDEVYEHTGLKVGSIPPLGTVLNFPSIYDESIKEKDMVVFNAGSLTHSIQLKAKDLIDLENPEFADIT